MSLVSSGRRFIQCVLPGVLRPLRVLWNQIIGFVFLVLALWATPRCVRSVQEFDGNTESLFRLLLTGIFIVTMGGFGIYSFLRARRASRS